MNFRTASVWNAQTRSPQDKVGMWPRDKVGTVFPFICASVGISGMVRRHTTSAMSHDFCIIGYVNWVHISILYLSDNYIHRQNVKSCELSVLQLDLSPWHSNHALTWDKTMAQSNQLASHTIVRITIGNWPSFLVRSPSTLPSGWPLLQTNKSFMP